MGTERVVLRQRHVLDCSPRCLLSLKPMRPPRRASGVRRARIGSAPSTTSVQRGADRAQRGGRDPDAVRRHREPRSAEGRAEREADLPRERVERHVAAEEARLGEIGDERRLRRRRAGTRRSRTRPSTTTRTSERRRRGDAAPAIGTSSHAPAQSSAEERQRRHPPPPAREPRDRQLREDDHERVDEEEQPDLRLVEAGLVLRVHGEDVEAGEAGEDEEGVQRRSPPRTARCRRTSRYEPVLPGRARRRRASGSRDERRPSRSA